MNYYDHLKHEYSCKSCGWIGLGEQAETGEAFDALFEFHCPKCLKQLGHIAYPTHYQVRQYGTGEEIKREDGSEYEKIRF